MLRRTVPGAAVRRSFSSFASKKHDGCTEFCRVAPSLHHTATVVVPRSLSYVNNGNFYNRYTQNRSFFFSGGSDNDSSDDGNDDKKKKKDNKDDKKDKKDDKEDKDNKEDDKDESDTDNSSSEPSPSLNNSARYKSSSSDAYIRSSPSNVLLPASRLGFGDQAPRYPHMMALPVVRGPVFPGVLTPITISDKVRYINTNDMSLFTLGFFSNPNPNYLQTQHINITQKTIQAVEKILSGGSGGYLGLFLRKDEEMDDPTKPLEFPEVITKGSDLYDVGTFAQIQRMTKADEDGHVHPFDEPKDQDEQESNPDHAHLLIMPHRRINLLSVDEVGPPIDVTVSHWERLQYTRGDDSSRDDTIRALCQEVLSTIREVAQMNSLFKEQVVNLVPSSHLFDMNDPYRLADFAASLSSGGDTADLQAVLEEKDAEARLHKALVLLTKEREVSKLQKDIGKKVEEKMSEAQRKYFLTEQLKTIKKELGMEKDDKETLIEKYRKKLSEYPAIPEEIDEIIESELDKLSTLEKNSSEFNVTRSYLDWLTNIPWGITTEENFDITAARRVLDRDHYGMDEVKETILQFIAVGKLKGTVQGKILCLAGPPGTGKVSWCTEFVSILSA